MIGLATIASIVALHSGVIVNTPQSPLQCGDAIRIGIQANALTARQVRISVLDQPTKRLWWSREALAYLNRWRFWYLPSGKRGSCHATIIKYRGTFPDGKPWQLRFVIKFDRELF